jgi:hypothetical protein
MTHLRFVIVAAAVVFAAPAHAFTYEFKDYGNPDGTPKYTDPDTSVEGFGKQFGKPLRNEDGSTATGNGNVRFNFSVGPSDSLFGPSKRFSPAWGPQPLPDPR